MGTIPKPKRTVTIQMGPHIAAVDSLVNKEPNVNWEKEPGLKLYRTSTSPKEQRQDNVCTRTLSMSVANKNHDSRKPSKADMSSSTSSANEGNKDTEDLIGRDPIGQCVGDVRESTGNSCKASAAEEPPLPVPQKDDLRTRNGALEAHNFEEMSADPKAEKLRSRTSEDFQKCEVNAALAQASRETSVPKPAASEGEADGAANEGVPVPVKSEGSGRTVQTSPLEVHREDFERPGTKEGEASPLKPSEGISRGCVTSAPLNGTELTDTKGDPSLVCPEQELRAQKDSDSSSLPQSSVLLLRDSATSGGQQSKADPAQWTEGGPRNTGSMPQDTQQIQGGLSIDFKDAATMTATSPERHVSSRARCRDAEVQAVVDVCSRSASTSPCHFPVANAPELCCATVRGGDSPAGSQSATHPPSDDRSLKEGGVFSDAGVQTVISSDSFCKSQNTRISHHSSSAVHQDMELGARPKEPGLHLCHVQKGPLHPVYQINIATSGHSDHASSSSFHEEEPSMVDLQGLSQSESHDGHHIDSLHDKPTASNHECQVVADIVSLPTRSESPPRAPACSSQPDSRLHVKTQMQSDVESHQLEPLSVEKNTKQKDVVHEEKSKPESDQSSKPSRSRSKSKSCQRDADVQPEADQGGSEDESKEDKQGKNEVVPNVVWDEQGMTWEVYGASVDLESLGFAIQSHLLCKIKEHEKQIKTQTTRIRKSLSTESPLGRKTKKRPRNVFRSLLQNVSRPKCCTRVPPSALE